MKKRVLFVDDEVLVLQGLQRMVRGLRDEWDAVFVASASEALAAMAEAPFDVVVSDIQMPGMNGADLLAKVKELYPKTVRMALSGHADQALVMRCLESAHQYLTKPCDPAELRERIRQAGSLGGALEGRGLRQVISRIDQLPILPTLYCELVKALESERSGTEELAHVIRRDPGMSAKILKVANSAFFGLPRYVADPAQAVAFLGVETLKSLVLIHGLFGQVTPIPTRGMTIRQVWSHSLRVAMGARAIALLEPGEGGLGDEAFAAGLLHDIGILILATWAPDRYDQVISRSLAERQPVDVAEREIFGATHAEVGAYLLGLWGLPESLGQAAVGHHHPSDSGLKRFTSLTAVHVADALAWLPGEHLMFESASLDLDHVRAIGKLDRLPAWKDKLAGVGPLEEVVG